MNPYRIFELASYAIDFYLLIISLRIILSWFASGANIRGMEILSRITDPFLNIFRRAGFLRFGFLDFSALLGIFLLLFLSSLCRQFALGNISVSITLAVFVLTIFNGISSIVTVFAVITILRIVGFFIRVSSIETLWYRLDALLEPLAGKFIRFVLPKKTLPYKGTLGCFLAACVLAGLALRFSLPPLLSLVRLIPF